MCGGLIAWRFFLHQIQERVIPFDRSEYDRREYDWANYEPMINFEFNNTTNVYWFSNPDKRKPITPCLAADLKRWSGFDTNMTFQVSFNPEVSITQVCEIHRSFREAGLPAPKCMIEQNRGNKKGRRFSELRLGPNEQFEWYLKEWYIENRRDQACKSIKEKTKKSEN